ncbi:D-arabinono-1,4-lactone oxidase [Undibacterium sp. Di26W]|uniref:D-arabinono-1,4-lactone oxidase n=1 Tax=Undibacterium sp. Di26W TaxID=3413035 RepID=UPI003BF00943
MPPITTNSSSPSSPTWQNWSQNLFYQGDNYYYAPRTRADLLAIISNAAAQNKQVRVSGQRHSQTPLVASSESPASNFVIIDMSCYADLGEDGNQRMQLSSDGKSVSVNTGVREDELDAFLTQNKLMLETVTAGGFFSLGGMTAVDVHGATVQAPIFAETVTAFAIMGPSGAVKVIDSSTATAGAWSPLQFARVSLGALGVVTAVTIRVLPRPYANSLTSGISDHVWESASDFGTGMAALLASKTRVETFFNPYAFTGTSNFMAAWWNVDSGSGAAPTPVPAQDACQLALKDEFGAPYLRFGEHLAEEAAIFAQDFSTPLVATGPAALITSTAISVIRSEVNTAGKNNSDLWLGEAARVIFMSYFIELPDLGASSLSKVWTALQSVSSKVNKSANFHIAAPMEFRFIKGGDTALAGTYTQSANAWFVNLDLIAFVAVNSSKNGLDYPAKMLSFFAEVESEWVAMGGWPHNGKMYGFYDPAVGPAAPTAPFNPAFLGQLRDRRQERVLAFETYRQSCDPTGMFSNPYVARLLGE